MLSRLTLLHVHQLLDNYLVFILVNQLMLL
jgi:hypothetical protein